MKSQWKMRRLLSHFGNHATVNTDGSSPSGFPPGFEDAIIPKKVTPKGVKGELKGQKEKTIIGLSRDLGIGGGMLGANGDGYDGGNGRVKLIQWFYYH